jgi:Presenilin enhancer-2 subunit of gamma secretase
VGSECRVVFLGSFQEEPIRRAETNQTMLVQFSAQCENTRLIHDKIISSLDVVMSAIGAAVWIAGLTAWIIVFQTKRAEWGAFADSISFMIPQGIP